MHLDLLTHSLKAPPLCAGGLPPPPMPGGVCPSAPCAHQRHVATAFAAAHARKAPASASRALDLASRATKVCNSGDHLPRWPKQRGALDFLCPPALGTYVPCASWLVGAPLHPCRLLLCAANHRNARHTPASCPRPIGTHRKWATHL